MTNSPSADRPTDARPLGLSRQRELIAQPVFYRGRRHWCLKDPLTLRYFQIRDEEYFILQQLKDTSTLETIRESFARAFAPRRLDSWQLQGFLGMLHREGLVTSTAAGQGAQLLDRRHRQSRDEWLAALANPLTVRFRGIDPDRFLSRLHAAGRSLCSCWFVSFGLLMMLAALLLVTVQWETLQQRLPTFEAFFQPPQLIWLVLAISGAKILHEFGHGLACKHFGGECHELGVMFLVFSPCLYCNVSDAWMLPSKWQRMAISAAGIYVDMFLAAVCTWIWWFTNPGLINSLCLNMMFIGTVGTLVFNGNPLLRYDGYYLLSDLVEIPNLGSRAAILVRRAAANLVLGRDTGDLPGEDEMQWWLIAYHLTATAYRWLLTLVILATLHRAAEPYALAALVEVLGIFVIGLTLLLPAWRLVRSGMTPHRPRPTGIRLASMTTAVLLIVAGVVWLPLPFRVTAPAIVQAGATRRIYVTVPGRLTEARSLGETIQPGEILARLENPELSLEVARLTSQRDLQRLQLDSLQRLSVQETRAGVQSAGAQVPAARKVLADIEERLRKRQADLDELTVRSPVAGTIFPSRRVEKKGQAGELPAWSGTPLEMANRGCFLNTGVMLCQVGDAMAREAILLVNDSDMDLIVPGQTVRLQFDQVPGRFVQGRVTEVASIRAGKVAPELVRFGSPPTHRTPDGSFQSLHPVYQVSVLLETSDVPLLLGTCGFGKIAVSPLSLAKRVARFARHWLRWNS